MSQVTLQTEAPLKTVTLHNGQVFKVKSNISTELEKIPIIDVAGMYSEKLEDRQYVAEQIREASRNIGFFYVVNHVSHEWQSYDRCGYMEKDLRIGADKVNQGIDMDLATKTLDQAKRFFALPTEKKMEVYTGLVPDEYCGYHPMEHYNRNGWKQQGRSRPGFLLISESMANACRIRPQ